MSDVRLGVRRLDPRAVVPERAHEGDAGLDLTSIEELTIAPGQRVRVRTGVAIELPPGHAGLVLPRSGLAAKHGIAIVNAPGLIDEGYRGEVQVLLLNTDAEAPFTVEAGMRIAQLVVAPVAAAVVVELDALSPTGRGSGGFGSSGA